MQCVIVLYYNVRFYLNLKGEEDVIKFAYFQKRIEEGEQLLMKDIYVWCKGQKIHVETEFQYLRRLPLKADIWNYYCYLRAKKEFGAR